MRKFLIFILLCLSLPVNADVIHEMDREGDHFVYVPDETPKHILVISHGMLSKGEAASDVANRYISRWVKYAEKYELLLIAPVFDTPRFGNLGGGYGGYRNLFGKYIAADEFVNKLVNRYSVRTTSGSKRFYLYGHSAGGQFVNRYVVTHPDNIIHAVVSAAGRYSYPTKSSKWPYGAGNLFKAITWKDGSRSRVAITRSLRNYALAAGKVSIVIGSEDTKRQPKRPAHSGNTRIEIANSWAREMNRNSKRYGLEGAVNVNVIKGIGHSSSALTPYCANVLFGG
ncbi:hypothetical protein [Marinimicrobium agarilyticum]|uniref:hypothetical protein n=1 Tax=Marinimicrobium agarilyticum TaxID=306546 RepID=UPI0012F6BC99|nr:hypothetical protein [Marinimicrobium agarilyticum]